MTIKVSTNVPNLAAAGVTLTVQSLAVKRGKLKSRAAAAKPSGSFVIDAINRHESRPPTHIIVHTTGAGLAARVKAPEKAAWRAAHPEAARSTFGAGVWVYCNANDAAPHVLIGQRGERANLVPEELIAWHVGSAGAQKYGSALWARPKIYQWWRERWAGLTSPRDFGVWSTGSCNAVSLGVEVACPLEDPTGPWSDAAWARLAALVREWSDRYGIPIDDRHVLTHSDVHPVSRTSKGQPWDPGPRQWPGFGELARRISLIDQATPTRAG